MQGEGKRSSAWISLLIVGSMTGDTAWRVTGFVLRVSSSFCLTSVRENNWKNVCWKTALFSLFSTRANHEGGGKVDLFRFKLAGCLHDNVIAFRRCVTHVNSAGRPNSLYSKSLFFSSDPLLLLLSYFLLCLGRTAAGCTAVENHGGGGGVVMPCCDTMIFAAAQAIF